MREYSTVGGKAKHKRAFNKRLHSVEVCEFYIYTSKMFICRQISTQWWGLLRICQSDGDVLIDIRLFKDEEGTSDGIQITKMQWQYLKNSIAHIDSSIMRISHWIYFVIIISFNDEHRRFTVVLKRLSKVGLHRFVCHSAVWVELYPQSVIYTPHKVIKYNQNKLNSSNIANNYCLVKK